MNRQRFKYHDLRDLFGGSPKARKTAEIDERRQPQPQQSAEQTATDTPSQ